MLAAALLLLCALPGRAQLPYGDKGIFPVYEDGGKWLIFDKKAVKDSKRNKKHDKRLEPGRRLLVIGSRGSELFNVERTTSTYGGACAGRVPLRLPAAVLSGARDAVGIPVIALAVRDGYSLKGSKAGFTALGNRVGEDTYQLLGKVLKDRALEEVRDGNFRFKLDDAPTREFLDNPPPEQIALKIEFASGIKLQGMASPMVVIEGTQVLGTYRRCLRLADGGRLVGDCVEMPSDLRVETSLLNFLSYDPKGRGRPYLLAFTSAPPLWGHERWGFALRSVGVKAFLMDAMDARCRESF